MKVGTVDNPLENEGKTGNQPPKIKGGGTEIKSSKKPLKVWGKGPVKFYDIELDCYILEDGTAVLNSAKMMKAIGRPWKGQYKKDELPTFIGAANLRPFVEKSPELLERLKGIEFYDGSVLTSGYHADILPLVCNVYLEARQARALTPNQLPIAQKCEILIRSFARVGIVALIYERLGFERYKNPEALRMLIESYFADDVRKWFKEFPDELYAQLDRIYGNEKTTSRNRPLYYATFTRKYIYDPVEKGLVLKELDKRNPSKGGRRKERHHSLLNEEKGLKALRAMIWQVVGTLKISANKRRFENAYARLMGQPFTEDMFDKEM